MEHHVYTHSTTLYCSLMFLEPAQTIYIDILSKLKTNPVLCVFDLDSTLFNVTGRSQKILQDFVAQDSIRRQFPKESALIDTIELHHDDWGIRKPMHKHGITNSDFYTEAREFWGKWFFANEYLKYDKPYSGAVDFVNEIYKTSAQIMYLTGRDRPRMGNGTVESLKQWSLPIPEEGKVVLEMKPDSGLIDEDYKTDLLRPYNSDSTWFFENEPVIINRVHDQLSNINIIVLDTVHSGREAIEAELVRIPENYK